MTADIKTIHKEYYLRESIRQDLNKAADEWMHKTKINEAFRTGLKRGFKAGLIGGVLIAVLLGSIIRLSLYALFI